MELPREAQATSQPGNHLEGWREFFKINCAALFQTALLLTADPERAEASVVAAIDSLDVSAFPDCTALATVHESVATRAIAIRRTQDTSKLVEAQVMLPNELRPILQIDPSSRVCFVLRMLLGYATSSCARMMGVEEPAVKILLRIAILQLHIAVTGNRKRDDGIALAADRRIDHWITDSQAAGLLRAQHLRHALLSKAECELCREVHYLRS